MLSYSIRIFVIARYFLYFTIICFISYQDIFFNGINNMMIKNNGYSCNILEHELELIIVLEKKKKKIYNNLSCGDKGLQKKKKNSK